MKLPAYTAKMEIFFELAFQQTQGSIVDFADLRDEELVVSNGVAVDPKFYEFGIQQESASIHFGDLGKETYELIARPLTRYTLFQSMMENHYEELCGNKNEAWLYHGNNKLCEESLDARLRKSLSGFLILMRFLHEP